MLDEKQRKVLDGIVSKMVQERKPDSEIRAAVASFKSNPTSFSSSSENNSQSGTKERGLVSKVAKGALDLGIGAVKGATQTLQNVGNVVAKPLGKAMGVPEEEMGFSDEALEGKNTAQKVGKFAERVGEFAVPVSKISTATKGLSFLPRVATRTAGDVALATVQDGSLDNAGTVGTISAGLQVGSPILRMAGGILGNTLKRTAGTVSGVGSDVIEQTLKTPREALSTIKVPALKTLKEDVSNILKQTRQLSKDSSKAYGEALADLPKALGRPAKVVTAGGKTTIRVGDKTYTLSTLGVKQNATKVLMEFGAKVNAKKGVIDFMETTLDKGETKRLQEVWNLVRQWKNTTPEGLNTLATKINGYKKGMGGQSKQLNTMIGKIATGVRSYVGERVPAIKTLNDRYTKEQRFISELGAHLGTKNGFDTPQNAKIVASKLQSLFGKNKEMAREVLDSLQGGISGRQAGREFATDVPVSEARIGDKVSGLFKAIIPPSTVGTIVAQTGLQLERVKPIVDALGGLDPASRITILNLLRESE